MSAGRSTAVAQRAVIRRLFSLALPVMGLNVLAVLALVVDMAMCGRLPDAEVALAGLGFSSQVVFLLAVAVIGLSIGTVAVAARAFGGGDIARVNRVLGQSGVLAVGVGLAVAGAGGLLARPVIRLLGAEGAPLEAGAQYLELILLGSPFYYLSLLYAAALRAVGETRTAFSTQLVTNGLNAGLNYLLIFGHLGLPALGIRGAALATVISQAVNASLLAIAIQRGVAPGVRLSWPRPLVDRALIGVLVRTGWPAAVDILVMNAAFLSVIGMIGRIDAAAVAAHGIGLRLQALAFVPGLGIAQATAALVGQSLGASDTEGAQRVFRASLLLCVSVMSTLGLVIMIGAEPILTLFDVERGTAVGEFALTWMFILGAGMPPVAAFMAINGVLMGAGATLLGLRINLLSTFGVQIPAAAILAFPLGLGATGAWLSFVLAWCVKLWLGSVIYRRGTWAATVGPPITGRAD
jgi:putative MATE family efflux protein